MILDGFPKVIWINLDRCAKRKAYMEQLLKKYAITNYRIRAVDGTNPRDPELVNICIKNNRLTAPENACACSHLKAMKFFVDNIEDSEIIIFEDDISFDFLQFIPYDWSEFIKNLPTGYDVIQLAITYENGSINNTLIKTDPSSKYYCSAAYLITKLGAQKILDRYYSDIFRKYDLSVQEYATADSMISSTGSTYSIPIFTYQTSDSTIHPRHIYTHNRSKLQQYQLWKNTMDNIGQFDKEKYFDNFAKN